MRITVYRLYREGYEHPEEEGIGLRGGVPYIYRATAEGVNLDELPAFPIHELTCESMAVAVADIIKEFRKLRGDFKDVSISFTTTDALVYLPGKGLFQVRHFGESQSDFSTMLDRELGSD